MSKKVTMKAKKVTKSVTKKATPKKKVVAKKVVKKAQPKKKVVAKKVVAKKQTKAVAKKVVAKKVTKKQAIKDKITNMYKIVTNYSENLMQDVYSVVYRTKTLKRFINQNLANKYIEQEVLVRMAEHSIKTAKKSRAVAKEIEAEFE
jgi:colicin import membrane protein